MHPNSVFDWTNRDEMLRFVDKRSFAQVFTASGAGLHVVHVPVIVTPEERVRFHVARRNRIAERLHNARLLVSVAGRDAYQSANWYVSENQVPTWHYETVEIEGPARKLDGEELVKLLDELSSRHEARLQPDRPWTRDKMEPGRFEAMTKAIVGFEIAIEQLRGTRKFNQHKDAKDIAAGIEGQREAGRHDIASAMSELGR